jgi:hypothetical protein
MARQGWRMLAAAAAAGALLVAWAGDVSATRIRPGTISLGFQGEYSKLGGGTYLARAFDVGGLGFQVKVRYRMRHGFLAGATFSQQFYHPADGGSADTMDKATVVSAGLELGKVFGSTDHPVYFLLGGGVWSPTAFSTSGEAYEGNKADRLYLSGTLGTEIFVRRAITVDLSLRGLIHAADETSYPSGETAGSTKLDHEIQLSAGVHFYVLD